MIHRALRHSAARERYAETMFVNQEHNAQVLQTAAMKVWIQTVLQVTASQADVQRPDNVDMGIFVSKASIQEAVDYMLYVL